MSESQSELNWLAFQYVANELDAAETTDFESLLLTDQSAREAVAKMVGESVELRSALGTATVATASSHEGSWNRKASRVAIVTVGSCLTLLLAVCFIRPMTPVSDRVVDKSVESDSPAQLAYAWAESRQGLDDLQSSLGIDLSDTLGSALSDAPVAESDQPLVAPSWMLAALTKQGAGFDSELDIQE
ncbi:MAG: hypothetical protein H8E66_23910 [Planctomycetes bacterium]|nr:hypothetical protein [Planctomycetota bacterium]